MSRPQMNSSSLAIKRTDDNWREDYGEGSEGAAADDLDLTLRNACGILSIETAYLKALACSLTPTVPLTHPHSFPAALMHFLSIMDIFS